MALREVDILKSRHGEENRPVFTEEDRARIRQTLSAYSSKKVNEAKKQKSQPSKVPSIIGQRYHVTFSWKDWPMELDEVPHLLLFRINIWPLLVHNTELLLEDLQDLCIQSGVSSLAVDNRASGYYMSGIFENGASVRNVYLTLTPSEANREMVQIRNCTFKTYND